MQNKLFDINKLSLNQMHEQFGIIAVAFHPFDELSSDEETWAKEQLESDKSEIEVNKDFIKEYFQLQKTYIYQGNKLYFSTHKKLKEFVEIVESQVDRYKKALVLAKIFIEQIIENGSYDEVDRIQVAKHIVKQITQALDKKE